MSGGWKQATSAKDARDCQVRWLMHLLFLFSTVSDELSKWNTELTAVFAAATSKLEAAKLTGSQVAEWDIATDKAWADQLEVTNPYLRSAMWASWKQALRKWQEEKK